MSGLGSVITSFQGDPSFRTLTNTKDPALQGQINDARSSASTLNTNAQAALRDYITKYMGNEGAAATRTAGEVGSIDQFYNGGYANQLASLRASQNTATMNAAKVATDQAIRTVNMGRLGEQGGGSSYDTRTAVGALQPIAVNAALANSQQARADLSGLTALQLGSLGQAQGLENSQAAYGMAPVAASQGLFQNRIANLGGISSLDNSNNIYGLQQKSTDLDKWGRFLDNSWNSAVSTASDVASVYGAFTGMGGMAGGGGGGGMGAMGGGGGGARRMEGPPSPDYGPYGNAAPTIGASSYGNYGGGFSGGSGGSGGFTPQQMMMMMQMMQGMRN